MLSRKQSLALRCDKAPSIFQTTRSRAFSLLSIVKIMHFFYKICLASKQKKRSNSCQVKMKTLAILMVSKHYNCATCVTVPQSFSHSKGFFLNAFVSLTLIRVRRHPPLKHRHASYLARGKPAPDGDASGSDGGATCFSRAADVDGVREESVDG